jgi:hypothetical protein
MDSSIQNPRCFYVLKSLRLCSWSSGVARHAENVGAALKPRRVSPGSGGRRGRCRCGHQKKHLIAECPSVEMDVMSTRRSWLVKGQPKRNDFERWLVPGRRMPWHTARPPRNWREGDLLFFWKGAPACEVVGLGELVRKEPGHGRFHVRYLSRMLEQPISLHACRRDRELRSASFVKPGAAGTVFPLTADQAKRLHTMVRRKNPRFSAPKPSSTAVPQLALSIRQPWAELILRGEKRIEVRTRRTHVRGPIFLYASCKRIHPDHERRIEKSRHIVIDGLPRGVLVGVIDLRGCRPLRRTDSKNAAFPVGDPNGDWAWEVAPIERWTKQRRPRRQPQPVFFRPF